MEIRHEDLTIRTLGKPVMDSPLKLSKIDGDFLTNYVEDHERVLFNNSLCKVKAEIAGGQEPLSFEKAGPREKIFFDPARTRAGIVTCGGLCPGINDVIRGIVMQLHFWYGVKNIYGFRYGYLGMIKESGLQPMVLDPDVVSEIHEKGGTILGSSRGPQEVGLMVDRLMDYNIVVTADTDQVLERGELRDNISREEIQERLKNQISLNEKIERADYVIDNSGALENTRRQVVEIWNTLKNSTRRE